MINGERSWKGAWANYDDLLPHGKANDKLRTPKAFATRSLRERAHSEELSARGRAGRRGTGWRGGPYGQADADPEMRDFRDLPAENVRVQP
ncbi:hypothetical protein SBV1_300029 [Verrucomicrobia bacterium]|nr:hypothetical protein SBV1_300029 [Verrucomicrobiota bacterium]